MEVDKEGTIDVVDRYLTAFSTLGTSFFKGGASGSPFLQGGARGTSGGGAEFALGLEIPESVFSESEFSETEFSESESAL